MAMPLFDLYFDKWVANFEKRIKISGISRLLRAAGAKAAVLAAEYRRQHRRILARPIERDSRFRAVNQWKGAGRNTEKIMLTKWQHRWRAAVASSIRGDLAARRGPDLSNHKVYKDLYKHQASVLMQARTGCVGMADFLFKRRVPGVPSPLCSCGDAPETPKHVLLYCNKTAGKRGIIRRLVALIALRIRRNLAQFSLKHPGLIVEWLLQTGKFALYNKARSL
jgi:hypothetical protein